MSIALTLWLVAILALSRWFPAPITLLAIVLPTAFAIAWQAWVLWIGWYVHQPSDGTEE